VIILLYGTVYGGVMGKGSWCERGKRSSKSSDWMTKKKMMKQVEMNKDIDKMMQQDTEK